MERNRSWVHNALRGTALGALVGIALIGIGVIRALVTLLGGGRFAPFTNADWRLLVFYVGGFAFVGGILGAVRIQERGRTAIVFGAMAAGIVVMFAFVAGDKGGLSGMDRLDWIVLPALGALFGAAAAYGYLRR